MFSTCTGSPLEIKRLLTISFICHGRSSLAMQNALTGWLFKFVSLSATQVLR